MAGPDSAVMCNSINTHTHTHNLYTHVTTIKYIVYSIYSLMEGGGGGANVSSFD